jgi:hypothetical protein
MSGIDAKYIALGGVNGFLGVPETYPQGASS